MSILSVEGLGVRFGGLRAVDGVSFAVEPGEIFAIVGPNGAGKTTLFNLLSGIYPPTEGKINYDGRNLAGAASSTMARAGIGRTFQNIELFDRSSVLDNLLLGCHRHSNVTLVEDLLHLPRARRAELAARQRAEDVIEFLDLQHHRRAAVQHLPYGARKIVELGRALCAAPRLLLLDEPSSGLNPDERDDMANWIADIRDILGITIMIIEHDMKLVTQVSDRVMAMALGRVVAIDRPETVLSHPEVMRAYLGEAA
jgi:branched-chain amino acid transport system ATP-binding protein